MVSAGADIGVIQKIISILRGNMQIGDTAKSKKGHGKVKFGT